MGAFDPCRRVAEGRLARTVRSAPMTCFGPVLDPIAVRAAEAQPTKIGESYDIYAWSTITTAQA